MHTHFTKKKKKKKKKKKTTSKIYAGLQPGVNKKYISFAYKLCMLGKQKQKKKKKKKKTNKKKKKKKINGSILKYFFLIFPWK